MTDQPPRRPPELLVHGDDEPPRGRSRRTQVVAVLVLAVAVALAEAAVLVRDDRAADQRRRAAEAAADAAPRLSLRADQEGTPRGGPRPVGIRVVVANDGPADVRVVSGRVLPGAWRVVVPDHPLRRGGSVALELVPPAGCTADRPVRLLLQVEVASGRTVGSTLDVADAPLLYGGHLEDAVAALGLTCDPAVR